MPLNHFQFRLSTLMFLVTLVAVGTFLWQRYITPNVAGVSYESGNLILYMTPEFATRKLSQMAQPTPRDAADVIFHDSYIRIPLLTQVLVLLTLFALAIGVFKLRRVCSVSKSTRPELRA